MIIELIIAYLIGSIPTAYLVLRLIHKKNVFKSGSGNMGATNAFIVTKSKSTGLVIFFIDVLKGFITVSLININPLLSGSLCILGHNYSVFTKFRGGKGLASMFGILLFISPLIAFTIFGLMIIIRLIVIKFRLITYEFIEVLIRVLITSVTVFFINPALVTHSLLFQGINVLKYITNNELKKKFSFKNIV